MDINTSETIDEISVTFLKPYQLKRNATAKKWWHINKKLLPFKLHYFFLSASLSTVIPFIAVFVKDTLQLSATSLGAVMVCQKFLFVLTKSSIGYAADYFNKLKLIISLLVVSQGIFLLLLFLIPYSLKESTESDNNSTDLACDVCYSVNASIKTEKLSVYFSERVDSNETHFISLPPNKECHFLNKNSTVPVENYGKLRIPTIYHATKRNTSSGMTSDFIFVNHDTDVVHTTSLSNQTYFKTLACNSSISSKAFCAIYLNNCTICCDIDRNCYFISNFQKKLTPSGISKSFMTDILTIQFWLFAIIFVCSNVCINSLFNLSDTALYEGVQNHGGEFGKQRLFSCVGWGLGAVIGGLIMDYTNNYLANFTVYAVLALINLRNIYKLDFVKPNRSSNILKDIRSALKSTELLCFEIGVFIMGIGVGFVWFYLIWYVISIGGNQLLCGLLHTVESFTGDIPFFFISGWVIRKIGYFHVMSLAFFSYAVRFIWYSQLRNPWLILPISWTSGLTYALFYAAISSYAKKNAKPGTEATTQSMMSASYFDLGGGIGNIIAGVGFDHFGGRNMFFSTGIFYAICSVFCLVCTLTFGRRNGPADSADL